MRDRDSAGSDMAVARDQRLARMTGAWFLMTFLTSIPAVALFYLPALADPDFVLGGGYHRGLAWGAVLEMGLILSNIATALCLYPVLRHESPALALAYVAARITECVFIAPGIVAVLALNSLRADPAGLDTDGLRTAAALLGAVHDWTFRLVPGWWSAPATGSSSAICPGAPGWRHAPCRPLA